MRECRQFPFIDTNIVDNNSCNTSDNADIAYRDIIITLGQILHPYWTIPIPVNRKISQLKELRVSQME